MRYRELGLLAEGGMAIIARAETDTGAAVVIKRVRPPFCFDQSFLRLFADEGEVHAALDHENIVRLLDRGEDQAGPFLVFEHIEGTDLSLVLQELPPLDVECVLAIALPLFRALAAAHTTCSATGACLDVVHRDVSPGNVLIGDDGAVKLADFGVASFALKSEHTVAGEMKGKFAYMAPEQTRGEKVDPRTDLFAAGVVLWECLAGKRLFEGATDADVVASVRHQPAARLDALRADLPLALVELIDQLLDKEPARRPPNADDVVTSLEDIVRARGLDEGLARFAARLARATPRRAPLGKDVDPRRRTQRVLGADMAATLVRRPRARRLVLAAVLGAAVVVLVVAVVRSETIRPVSEEPAPPPRDTVVAVPLPLPLPQAPPPPSLNAKAVVRAPAASIIARPPAATGFGRLSLASEPWANVTVDGALVDTETPLFAFPLPAGTHTIVLENPVYGLKRTITLDIPADGEVKRFVDLNRP